MAAPPDPEKEPRRHWAPITGIIVVVLVVLLGFAWWLQDETDQPEMPGEGAYEGATPPGTTGVEPTAGTEPADDDDTDQNAEGATAPQETAPGNR